MMDNKCVGEFELEILLTEKRTGIPQDELIRLIWQAVEDRLSHGDKHI